MFLGLTLVRTLGIVDCLWWLFVLFSVFMFVWYFDGLDCLCLFYCGWCVYSWLIYFYVCVFGFVYVFGFGLLLLLLFVCDSYVVFVLFWVLG